MWIIYKTKQGLLLANRPNGPTFFRPVYMFHEFQLFQKILDGSFSIEFERTDTLFDSSFNVLSKTFWLRFDPIAHSSANRRNEQRQLPDIRWTCDKTFRPIVLDSKGELQSSFRAISWYVFHSFQQFTWLKLLKFSLESVPLLPGRWLEEDFMDFWLIRRCLSGPRNNSLRPIRPKMEAPCHHHTPDFAPMKVIV